MISVLFTVALSALLVFWLGASYRRILRLRILVSHAWKRLDEHVKRRIEIIGKTLELARNAGIEGAELDRVARAHARSTPYRGPSEAGQRYAELDHALNELISFMGQHPGAGGALRAIAEDVSPVTHAVVQARDTYNGHAANYNRAIGVLPGNLIAGMTSFHRAEVF
ncbi:MAG: LemA family protein [Vicinamibacterales bacterium]